MTIILLLALAYVLERTLLVISSENMTSPYNGLGCVDDVLAGTALAPMAYRVLMPWSMAGLKRLRAGKLESYSLLRFLMIFYALYAVSYTWNWMLAIVVGVLLTATFTYDYWDWAIELGSVALAFSGEWELALFAVMLHSFSRENWLLTPLAYFVRSGDVWGTAALVGAGGIIFGMILLIVGRRKMYCKRFMFLSNFGDIKEALGRRLWWMQEFWTSIAITGVSAAGAAVQIPGWQMPIAIVISGWVFGRVAEARVLSAALPWVGILLLNWTVI